MTVRVVGSDRNDPDEMSIYYNSLFSRLSGVNLGPHYLEIGHTHGVSKSMLHIIGGQLRLWNNFGGLKPVGFRLLSLEVHR